MIECLWFSDKNLAYFYRPRTFQDELYLYFSNGRQRICIGEWPSEISEFAARIPSDTHSLILTDSRDKEVKHWKLALPHLQAEIKTQPKLRLEWAIPKGRTCWVRAYFWSGKMDSHTAQGLPFRREYVVSSDGHLNLNPEDKVVIVSAETQDGLLSPATHLYPQFLPVLTATFVHQYNQELSQPEMLMTLSDQYSPGMFNGLIECDHKMGRIRRPIPINETFTFRSLLPGEYVNLYFNQEIPLQVVVRTKGKAYFLKPDNRTVNQYKYTYQPEPDVYQLRQMEGLQSRLNVYQHLTQYLRATNQSISNFLPSMISILKNSSPLLKEPIPLLSLWILLRKNEWIEQEQAQEPFIKNPQGSVIAEYLNMLKRQGLGLKGKRPGERLNHVVSQDEQEHQSHLKSSDKQNVTKVTSQKQSKKYSADDFSVKTSILSPSDTPQSEQITSREDCGSKGHDSSQKSADEIKNPTDRANDLPKSPLQQKQAQSQSPSESNKAKPEMGSGDNATLIKQEPQAKKFEANSFNNEMTRLDKLVQTLIPYTTDADAMIRKSFQKAGEIEINSWLQLNLGAFKTEEIQTFYEYRMKQDYTVKSEEIKSFHQALKEIPKLELLVNLKRVCIPDHQFHQQLSAFHDAFESKNALKIIALSEQWNVFTQSMLEHIKTLTNRPSLVLPWVKLKSMTGNIESLCELLVEATSNIPQDIDCSLSLQKEPSCELLLDAMGWVEFDKIKSQYQKELNEHLAWYFSFLVFREKTSLALPSEEYTVLWKDTHKHQEQFQLQWAWVEKLLKHHHLWEAYEKVSKQLSEKKVMLQDWEKNTRSWWEHLEFYNMETVFTANYHEALCFHSLSESIERIIGLQSAKFAELNEATLQPQIKETQNLLSQFEIPYNSLPDLGPLPQPQTDHWGAKFYQLIVYYQREVFDCYLKNLKSLWEKFLERKIQDFQKSHGFNIDSDLPREPVNLAYWLNVFLPKVDEWLFLRKKILCLNYNDKMGFDFFMGLSTPLETLLTKHCDVAADIPAITQFLKNVNQLDYPHLKGIVQTPQELDVWKNVERFKQEHEAFQAQFFPIKEEQASRFWPSELYDKLKQGLAKEKNVLVYQLFDKLQKK